MGNDVTCNIVGIGSIQLQMFDGTTKILTDVRHVPDLRKNLISLGALDSNGYKTVIQGGVMKIYKGILLVMKAKKVGNLFQLEGGIRSDFVSTVSEHESSSIHLWHQRLGHMSERGLKILADRKLLPNLRSGKLDFCKHCLFGKQSKQKFKQENILVKAYLLISIQMFGVQPLQHHMVARHILYRVLMTFLGKYGSTC